MTPEIILKLVELILNALGLFLPSKNNDSKQILVTTAPMPNQTFHPQNNTSSSNSNYPAVLMLVITLIAGFLFTFFYSAISLVLFLSTLIFTILKFKATHQYQFSPVTNHLLNFKATIYSFIALSTYFIPDFIKNLKNTLPAPTGITEHSEFLFAWVSEGTMTFTKQWLNLDNVTKVFSLMYLVTRFLLLYFIFYDISYLTTQKRLFTFVHKIESNKFAEYGVLIFILTLFYVSSYFEILREPFIEPIINYFS